MLWTRHMGQVVQYCRASQKNLEQTNLTVWLQSHPLGYRERRSVTHEHDRVKWSEAWPKDHPENTIKNLGETGNHCGAKSPSQLQEPCSTIIKVLKEKVNVRGIRQSLSSLLFPMVGAPSLLSRSGALSSSITVLLSDMRTAAENDTLQHAVLGVITSLIVCRSGS